MNVNGQDVGMVWGDPWSPVVWQHKHGRTQDKWEVVLNGQVLRTSVEVGSIENTEKCRSDDRFYCPSCFHILELPEPVCEECGENTGGRCSSTESLWNPRDYCRKCRREVSVVFYVPHCPECDSQGCRIPCLSAACESIVVYARMHKGGVSRCLNRLRQEQAISRLTSLSVLPKKVELDSGQCPLTRIVVLPLEEMSSVQCARLFASRILQPLDHEPATLCIATMTSWQTGGNYRKAAIRLTRVAEDCFQTYFLWEGYDDRITCYAGSDQDALTAEGIGRLWNELGP